MIGLVVTVVKGSDLEGKQVTDIRTGSERFTASAANHSIISLLITLLPSDQLLSKCFHLVVAAVQ
jgi:hypothetical protein